MERSMGNSAHARLKPRRAKHNHQRQRKRCSFPSFDAQLEVGWDQANGESVALKTFRTDPYIFDEHPCRHLVEYEIKSMDRVSSHSNIVRLIDVRVCSPSKFCLVMDAAAAARGNLMKTVAAAPEGRLSRVAARCYLGQLLDAVEHCHTRGVCHRDIQPQHLLVDTDSGNLKLSGFGRAGLWDPEAGDSTDLAYALVAPRLAHAAPEVVTRPTYCGKAADCWSVGAVLFTMLAGFSPFKTDEAEVGVYDRCLQPPSWVSPLARSLLRGLMEPDTEKRFTVAEVRAHPWFDGRRGGDRGELGSSSSYSSSSSSSSSGSSSSGGSSGGGERLGHQRQQRRRRVHQPQLKRSARERLMRAVNE